MTQLACFCPVCGGSGYEVDESMHDGSKRYTKSVCRTCGGSGSVIQDVPDTQQESA